MTAEHLSLSDLEHTMELQAAMLTGDTSCVDVAGVHRALDSNLYEWQQRNRRGTKNQEMTCPIMDAWNTK